MTSTLSSPWIPVLSEPGCHRHATPAFSVVAFLSSFWNSPESKRTMGFPHLRLDTSQSLFLAFASQPETFDSLLPAAQSHACFVLVVFPDSRTVPAIRGTPEICVELVICMSLPGLLLKLKKSATVPYFSRLPTPLLLSVTGGSLSSFLWFRFLSFAGSPFYWLLSNHPDWEASFPTSQSFHSSSLPFPGPCTSPWWDFPGLLTPRVCHCFPWLLSPPPHSAIRITSPRLKSRYWNT